MSVILIRHGRVEKVAGLPLSSEGAAFAGGLAGALARANIRAIMSTPDAHCLATVEPIARSLGVTVTTYSSESDVRDAIRQGDWTSTDILVLFRWGNASEIFDAVGLSGQSPASSDDAYGNIWFVNVESQTVSTSPTGF